MICFDQLGRKASAELDAANQRLMAQISAEGQAAFRKVDALWRDYMMAHCKFNLMGMEDTSLHHPLLLQCYGYMTRLRIKEVKSQLNCKEGEMPCRGSEGGLATLQCSLAATMMGALFGIRIGRSELFGQTVNIGCAFKLGMCSVYSKNSG